MAKRAGEGSVSLENSLTLHWCGERGFLSLQTETRSSADISSMPRSTLLCHCNRKHHLMILGFVSYLTLNHQRRVKSIRANRLPKEAILTCIHGYSLPNLPPHIRKKSSARGSAANYKKQGKIFTSNILYQHRPSLPFQNVYWQIYSVSTKACFPTWL